VTGAAFTPVPREHREEQVERLLLVLMGGRLGLALASLVVGLVLDAIGRDVAATVWPWFYVTAGLCFVATLVYRPFVGRIRRPIAFAAWNVLTDLALVSALVVFSGGRDSVFTFLYVVVALYGAVLFPGWGALLCAAGGAFAYGGVLALGQAGWLGAAVETQPGVGLLTGWLVHASALVAAAGLASFLARELERTGRVLDERTSDLAHLRTLHQRTVESLMSGLLTTDLDERVTSFNGEAQRITGLSRSDALGRELGEVLPGLSERLAPLGGLELGSRVRMPFRGARGEDMHLGVGAYVLRDVSGEAAGSVVIFQDVSGVVEMERELRRSERLAAVGQLSASIAHEIRNPLAAISGSIQMMRGTVAAGQDDSGRLMDIVVREVDRLDRLIRDFLQFARPGEPRLESVRVSELVDEVVEMFDTSRADGVRVEAAVPPELAALADAEQLRQVVWNLVLNAAEAMGEGGAIRIEAQRVGQEGERLRGGVPQGEHVGYRMEEEEKATWVEISVMDQGPGVPAHVVEHMFDPFFTTKTGGTGLGLATVHRVIEEHGGVVRVEAGTGDWATIIRVRLPLAEGSATAGEAS